MGTRLSRSLHPLAWWGWAVGVAVAASLTTNPLLLALLFAVVWLVVMARRGDSPWARSFRLYVALAALIVVIRLALHVLVGLKFGTVLVLPLPSIALPGWAAGINLLGNVYLEGLLGAGLLGLRLGMIVVAIGAANALANPKRLLRSMPGALHEIGTAVVVSVSVAPQLAESVQRVMRARLLRGDTSRGVRALPRVALPVLQDTLDRSLLLASAMESRGYGRRVSTEHRLLTGTVTLTGLLALALGMYGVLDTTTSPPWLGFPMLLAGLALVLAGLWLGGRAVRISSYRPDPWRVSETLTVLCGLSAAAAMVVTRQVDPASLDLSLQPLAAPVLPVVALAGVLLAALPAVLTPPPVRRRDR
ncbi:MAG: energy-coupling factor transporter transmembrane protein EcfT [Actinomycetota bacterium]|nr:energy-coupling factor transporter transmembrane protein EcfT [Actinomycetota bacterium]